MEMVGREENRNQNPGTAKEQHRTPSEVETLLLAATNTYNKGQGIEIKLNEELEKLISSHLQPRELNLLINLTFLVFKTGSSQTDLLIKTVVATRLTELTLSECCKLVWCLAKVDVIDKALLSKVAVKISACKVEDFSPSDLSHILWAFSRLSLPDPTLFEIGLNADFSKFSPEELVYALWAYTKSPLRKDQKNQAITVILQQTIPKLEMMTPFTFGTFVVSMNIAKRSPQTFSDRLVKFSLPLVHHFTPQTLAELSLLLSHEDIGPISPQLLTFWDQLEVRVGGELEIFGERNLAKLYSGFSGSQRDSSAILDFLWQRIAKSLPHQDELALTNVVFELANSRRALPDAVANSLARILQTKISELNLKNLCNMLRSCAIIFSRAANNDPAVEWSLPGELGMNRFPSVDLTTVSAEKPEVNLFLEIERVIISELPRMPPQMLADVARAFSSLTRSNEAFFQELALRVEKDMSQTFPMTPLADIFTSFLRARLRLNSLMDSGLSFIFMNRQKLTPAAFCAMLTALVELRFDTDRTAKTLASFLTPKFLEQFSPPQLVSVIWLLCCLESSDTDHFDYALRLLSSKNPEHLGKNDRALLSWSLAKLAHSDPEAAKFLDSKIMAPLKLDKKALFTRHELQRKRLSSILQLRKREVIECLRSLKLSGSLNFKTEDGIPIDIALESYRIGLFLLSRTALVKDLETKRSTMTATERACHEILRLSGWKIASLRAQLWRITPEAEKPGVIKALLVKANTKPEADEELEAESGV